MDKDKQGTEIGWVGQLIAFVLVLAIPATIWIIGTAVLTAIAVTVYYFVSWALGY